MDLQTPRSKLKGLHMGTGCVTPDANRHVVYVYVLILDWRSRINVTHSKPSEYTSHMNNNKDSAKSAKTPKRHRAPHPT